MYKREWEVAQEGSYYRLVYKNNYGHFSLYEYTEREDNKIPYHKSLEALEYKLEKIMRTENLDWIYLYDNKRKIIYLYFVCTTKTIKAKNKIFRGVKKRKDSEEEIAFLEEVGTFVRCKKREKEMGLYRVTFRQLKDFDLLEIWIRGRLSKRGIDTFKDWKIEDVSYKFISMKNGVYTDEKKKIKKKNKKMLNEDVHLLETPLFVEDYIALAKMMLEKWRKINNKIDLQDKEDVQKIKDKIEREEMKDRKHRDKFISGEETKEM